METIINICNDCGLNLSSHERVSGGDINDAYCLTTTEGKYFLKVNEKDKYPSMFEKEARGLDLLQRNCSLLVPRVIKTGSTATEQWLILEWLEKGSPANNFWQQFGHELAMMHKKKQEYFGLSEDNYIGSLKQVNERRNDWPSFYAECRILPLVKYLFDHGIFSATDLRSAETFCKRLTNVFPAEPPRLLHGDLWAGNYMIHSSGFAAIYDPAVYFGHREIDIGMSKLFGGFDEQFYTAYNDTYPFERDWQKRLPATQLYPLLVHAVLFGGHYISAAKNIMVSF